MESKQLPSIIFVGVTFLCISSLASAQLSYHLDANTNSYTVQTPNSQQSFTRYFNGQQAAANGIKATRAHPIQAAQSQQQPQRQLFSTSPQQFAYQTDAQEEVSAYYRQQQEYQNQIQQQQQQQQQELQRKQNEQYNSLHQEQQELQRKQNEQNNKLQQEQQLQQQELQRKQNEQNNNNLYTTYQVPQAQQTQQIQSQSQPDLSAYYQQIHQAQQQQQQLANQQQQLVNEQRYQPEPQTFKQFEQQEPANNLLGHKYSPSNEVSHVKYTSDGLNYNF